jgi:hypothetical protein
MKHVVRMLGYRHLLWGLGFVAGTHLVAACSGTDGTDPKLDASAPIPDATPTVDANPLDAISRDASNDVSKDASVGSDAAPDVATPKADAARDAQLDGAPAPTSTDGIKNGDETDVDCGGTEAPRCKDLQACSMPLDCKSMVCVGMICQVPTDSDATKNGSETDTDCGGPQTPKKCADTRACVADGDCTSQVCTVGSCTAPSSTDGKKNGSETGVDCGGAAAPACSSGQGCVLGTDCQSQICSMAICQAPSPTDGVRNGDESDIDCGGTLAPRCGIAKRCNALADCSNGVCRQNRCANVTHFGLNHILSTGQSNSTANGGSAPVSTTQPYQNRMFNTGVMSMQNCTGEGCTTYQTPTSLVPLIENDSFFAYTVETASSGLANQATRLARATYFAGNPVTDTHDVMVSLHGRSGNAYPCIRRGGCPFWYPGKTFVWPFAQGMREVADAKALANAAGLTYAVRAVTIIHGESDHYGYTNLYPMSGADGTPGKIRDYADGIIEMQADYEAGVLPITGQTVPVPMLVAQMHSWVGDTATNWSRVTRDQYLAHKRAPGKVVLVCPTYNLTFGDPLHFTNTQNRRLGEYFAKAYAKIVMAGEVWEPVRPKQVSRVGNVIRIQYHVPEPPLVLDTTRVVDPGNYGFEFSDNSGAPATITQVAVTGPDTVEITLSKVPTGTAQYVRYAYTRQGGSTNPGPTTGVRGNLRDSDATPSLYGNDLQNWGVTFEELVP